MFTFLGWWRSVLRKPVVINLDTGNAVTGLCWARHGTLVVLRNAQLHQPSGESQSLDGETIIDRHRIEFLQVVPDV